ncbi:MAG: anaerobic ribonucleoside-triphosphate reductase activating protein [Paraclostridium sp.]
MNYIKIDSCDMNNGDGCRVVLWVSGCDLNCDGCHNDEYKDFSCGNKFTDKELNYICELLNDNYISGLSILGGEPLHKNNIFKVTEICNYVKEKYPNKDIWLWTGYNIEKLPFIPNVDILIDGKYNRNLPTNKKWRGSDNQRMFKINDELIKQID